MMYRLLPSPADASSAGASCMNNPNGTECHSVTDVRTLHANTTAKCTACHNAIYSPTTKNCQDTGCHVGVNLDEHTATGVGTPVHHENGGNFASFATAGECAGCHDDSIAKEHFALDPYKPMPGRARSATRPTTRSGPTHPPRRRSRRRSRRAPSRAPAVTPPRRRPRPTCSARARLPRSEAPSSTTRGQVTASSPRWVARSRASRTSWRDPHAGRFRASRATGSRPPTTVAGGTSMVSLLQRVPRRRRRVRSVPTGRRSP